MRNMHMTALLGESDRRQTSKSSETTMSKAKKSWAEGETVNEREERTFVRMQGKTQRWGFKMEHSWTARPTCDRILYNYGDFSVALCFAPTVKTEQREIEKEGYHKLRENSEQREQSCYFFKHWEASGSKCALFKKELEISCFHPLQKVSA